MVGQGLIPAGAGTGPSCEIKQGCRKMGREQEGPRRSEPPLVRFRFGRRRPECRIAAPVPAETLVSPVSASAFPGFPGPRNEPLSGKGLRSETGPGLGPSRWLL